MAVNQNYGTGRRKCAIARVWLTAGDGKITINGREVKEYLGRPVLEILVKSPLVHLEMEGRYNVKATAKGGWKEATPENINGFSALLFSFGLRMQQDLNVPVGLMQGAVGGNITSK